MKAFAFVALILLVSPAAIQAKVCDKTDKTKLCRLVRFDKAQASSPEVSPIKRAVMLGYWRIHTEALRSKGYDVKREIAAIKRVAEALNRNLHQARLIDPNDRTTVAIGRKGDLLYSYKVDKDLYLRVATKKAPDTPDTKDANTSERCIDVADRRGDTLACLDAGTPVRIIGVTDSEYIVRFDDGRMGYLPQKNVESIVSVKKAKGGKNENDVD